jgi:hypothetical protein
MSEDLAQMLSAISAVDRVNAQVRDNGDGTVTLHWPFAFDHDDEFRLAIGH